MIGKVGNFQNIWSLIRYENMKMVNQLRTSNQQKARYSLKYFCYIITQTVRTCSVRRGPWSGKAHSAHLYRVDLRWISELHQRRCVSRFRFTSLQELSTLLLYTVHNILTVYTTTNQVFCDTIWFWFPGDGRLRTEIRRNALCYTII